jgi:hypothetical protein
VLVVTLSTYKLHKVSTIVVTLKQNTPQTTDLHRTKKLSTSLRGL